MEHLELPADVAVMSLSAGASVCRPRDRETAAAAASAGRRLMKSAFAAVRADIEIAHRITSSLS